PTPQGQPDSQSQSASSAHTAPSDNAALSTAGGSSSEAQAGGTSLYPSTYKVIPSAPTFIRHATVLTGTGTRLDGADVLLVEGKIAAVGAGLQPPANARIVEGDGLWVTPGLIDVH